MADGYTVKTSSSVRHYVEGLDREMRKRLRTTIKSLIERVASTARATAPQGKTRRLSTMIHTELRSRSNRIVGRVVDTAPYANVIEDGINKTLDVAQHVREIKMVFGRVVNPVEATIRAHKRNAAIDANPFLKAALDGYEAQIIQEIEAATYGASNE